MPAARMRLPQDLERRELTMTEFFASGRAIDLVLSLIALEAAALIVLWRMGRCPLPPRATLLILAPGTCLLFASRAVISGASGALISFLFLVALAIHLTDLRQRWRSQNRQTPDSPSKQSESQRATAGDVG
jgi:thiol:disulfide interchange protein